MISGTFRHALYISNDQEAMDEDDQCEHALCITDDHDTKTKHTASEPVLQTSSCSPTVSLVLFVKTKHRNG
ncbi:hypothetical protein NDU88_001237 [Pleurodeles waltl]|uniref:Uncharacterized protein n=1 Tax=Pleurodeles waltl TaxID=8319 RepID=A0AAV7V7N8_PLEWA|nr:hypothetical protein NDU88_001237 [Pleurodeles waltl]